MKFFAGAGFVMLAATAAWGQADRLAIQSEPAKGGTPGWHLGPSFPDPTGFTLVDADGMSALAGLKISADAGITGLNTANLSAIAESTGGASATSATAQATATTLQGAQLGQIDVGGIGNIGAELFQSLEPDGCLEHKHARVPKVTTLCQVALGCFTVGLFYKSLYLGCSTLGIA